VETMKTRRNSVFIPVLAVIASFVFAAASWVPTLAGTGELTNPSFDDTAPAITGWTTTIPAGGSATAVPTFTGVDGRVFDPIHGPFFALLKTDGPGSFTSVVQTMSVDVGDTIGGWAFFDCEDDAFFNDQAEVRIIRQSDGAIVATPFYSDCETLGGFASTPWTFWAYQFNESGDFLVEARVANAIDSDFDSYMGVDAVFAGMDNTHLFYQPNGTLFAFIASASTAPYFLGVICTGVLPGAVENFSGFYISFSPCEQDTSLLFTARGRNVPGQGLNGLAFLRGQGRRPVLPGFPPIFLGPDDITRININQDVATAGLTLGSKDSFSTQRPLQLKMLNMGRKGYWFVAQGQPVREIGVKIYGLSGKLVYDSGWVQGQSLRWTGLSNDGRSVANGVYLYVLTVRDPYGRIIKTEVRKLVLLR